VAVHRGCHNGTSIFSLEDGRLKRDVALRMDGVVSGARSQLNWLAHIAKENLTDDEYRLIVTQVGSAMGALYEVSKNLYEKFPDIVPDEMLPPSE
jgi:hypothetical protein